MVLKFCYVSESPGGLIQAQIAVLHPKVSIQEVGVRPRNLGYNIFPGVQMLLVTLRTTALEDDDSKMGRGGGVPQCEK